MIEIQIEKPIETFKFQIAPVVEFLSQLVVCGETLDVIVLFEKSICLHFFSLQGIAGNRNGCLGLSKNNSGCFLMFSDRARLFSGCVCLFWMRLIQESMFI